MTKQPNPSDPNAALIATINVLRGELESMRHDARRDELKVPIRKRETNRNHKDKREPEPPDRYERRRYHRDNHEVSCGFNRDTYLIAPHFAGTYTPEDRYDRKDLLDPHEWKRPCEQDTRYHLIERDNRQGPSYHHRRDEQNDRNGQIQPNDHDKGYHREQSIKHKATAPKQSRSSKAWDDEYAKCKSKTDESISRLIELLTPAKGTRPTPSQDKDVEQQRTIPMNAPSEEPTDKFKPEANGCEIVRFTNVIPQQDKGEDRNKQRGVLASLLIKEEPPDSPIRPHPNHRIVRGNILDPHLYREANLLYRCAGTLVLRTKPNQGGGNDAAIRTGRDLGPQDGPSEAEPEDPHTKETEISRSQQRSNSNVHLSPAPQPPCKTSGGKVSKLPNPDPRAFNRGFRPDQKESSNKMTCSGFLTLQGIWNNLNHPKTSSGWKVIQLSTRRFLDALHLEAHGDMSLQTYQWHPGDILTHPGVPQDTSKTANTPWIRRIHPCPYMDRPEPFMATTHTDRFNQDQNQAWRPRDILYDLEAYQYVPRRHYFQPKISRYKANGYLPYLDQFPHKWSNGSFY